MKKCVETPDSLSNKIKEKPHTPLIEHSGLGKLEGPVFFKDEVWCVEMEEGNLLHFKDGDFERIHIGGGPNGLTGGADERLYITDNQRQAILAFDPSEKRLSVVVEFIDGMSCLKANDLAFDRKGNLIFTCPQWPGQGKERGFLGFVRPDGRCGSFAHDFRFWNGLAFADDGQTLYVSDSSGSTLWKGGWDADACRWISPHPCLYVGSGLPDGMAVDQNGTVHLALFNAGCVIRYAGGDESLPPLKTPGPKSTNCAFDPARPGRLIITEMQNGQLLECQLPSPGLPLYSGAITSKQEQPLPLPIAAEAG